MAKRSCLVAQLFCFLLLCSLVFCKGPKRISRGSDGKPLSRIQFDAFRKEVEEETSRLFHIRGEETFAVPIEVDVLLVGFGGEGAFAYKMDDELLEELLARNYPSRRPFARETGEPLSSEFHIVYNVLRTPEDDIVKVENALKPLMRKGPMYRPDASDKVWGFEGVSSQSYNVEATQFEPVLKEIVDRFYGKKEEVNELRELQRNCAIVILNPSKRRMHPEPPEKNTEHPDLEIKPFSTSDWDRGVFDVNSLTNEEGGYLYQYEYNGAGKSQTWLSKHSFVVVDISAGPCKFGPPLSLNGAVTPSSIPRIMSILYEGATTLSLYDTSSDDLTPQIMEKAAQSRDSVFRGKIAAIIVSAINHLILPDVWVENVQDSRRVLAPFMLIRNHLDSNSLDVNDAHGINTAMLYEEIFRMMGSRERFVLAFSVHSLHEHRALAVALHKAMHTKSDGIILGSADQATGTSTLGFHSRVRSFLDGDVLLDEFERAADMLTSGWIGSAREADDLWTQPSHNRSVGTRVLPFFILSLRDAPYDLVLDNGGLVAGDDKAAIVLQTLTSYSGLRLGEVNTLHVAQDQQVMMSTLDIERHIMAGLATSLMGIPPPYESYSAYHPNKVDGDWLWATGHTPFGPYSNTSTFSALTVGVARRNMLLARVEKVIVPLRKMLEKLDDFLGEYVCPPFNELGIMDGNFGKSKSTWVDQLYKSDATETIVPKEVADRLEKLLTNVESALVDLSAQFYDGEVKAIEEGFDSFRKLTVELEKHIDMEIQNTRETFQCCGVVHRLPKPPSRAWIYAVLIFIGLCAWVIFGTCWIKEEDGPLLAVSNRYM